MVEPAARKRNYEELQKRLALAARHAWVSVGPWVRGSVGGTGSFFFERISYLILEFSTWHWEFFHSKGITFMSHLTLPSILLTYGVN